MPRLAIAVALFFALPHGADAEVTLEYRVKAAYLFNFLKFVDWPATAPGGPFTICVAGRNPFENVLQDTIRGEQVNGRAVVSRVILEPEPGCHLVFMPQGSASAAYLRAAKGAPVLTVGEDRDFIGQGGMVSFYPEGSRIRFEVNPDAAAQAQLRVSSRLLQLARIVNDQESAP